MNQWQPGSSRKMNLSIKTPWSANWRHLSFCSDFALVRLHLYSYAAPGRVGLVNVVCCGLRSEIGLISQHRTLLSKLTLSHQCGFPYYQRLKKIAYSGAGFKPAFWKMWFNRYISKKWSLGWLYVADRLRSCISLAWRCMSVFPWGYSFSNQTNIPQGQVKKGYFFNLICIK